MKERLMDAWMLSIEESNTRSVYLMAVILPVRSLYMVCNVRVSYFSVPTQETCGAAGPTFIFSCTLCSVLI